MSDNLEGKEIYKKYDPYNNDLISGGAASPKDIRRYRFHRHGPYPDTDPKQYRANRGLQKEHTRSEIQSKMAAISYAQEGGDRQLEINASLALTQILDEKIESFLKNGDYENAGIYIELIQELNERISELRRKDTIEFKKGEVLFLIEEVARLIDEVDIDREEILSITQKNPLIKINIEKQKELLKTKKMLAVFFLASLLDNVKKYLQISEKVKNDFERDLKVEENTRIRENALLEILRESLEKTMKFISLNFCKIDEEALMYWKCDEKIKNGEIPYFKRREMKKGVILPIGANVKNYAHIVFWAEKFKGEDLEKIKEHIFKNQSAGQEFYLMRTNNGNR